MDRRELVLAALSPAKGEIYTPVQVQKLFFLIDREIPDLVGGPLFAFKAYDYGPFDPAVYDELSSLAEEGMVATVPDWNWRDYRLLPPGQERGEKIFDQLDKKAQAFIADTVGFVRRLSFSELVSAIYKAYPEMRARSVFKE